MSLKKTCITTNITRFPSHIGIQAHSTANFEPQHVIPCTRLFQISLLFWYLNLRDLLTDLRSQCSRCIVSLDSRTGWWLVIFGVTWWGESFLIFSSRVFNRQIYHILGYFSLFTITPDSDLFLIAGHPATDNGKCWQGCLLKSNMRSGNITRSCRERLSKGNLQGHMPVYISRRYQRQLAIWHPKPSLHLADIPLLLPFRFHVSLLPFSQGTPLSFAKYSHSGLSS